MNVVVVRGKLSRSPEERELPSGSRVVSYEVTVGREDQRAESVPVAWLDPPAAALTPEVGEEVLVVGRVHRRFFRSGGITQSRTEVAAEHVIPTRRKARARRELERALDAIGGS